MRIDLEFVELHSPLFLAGINFGSKLYSGSKGNKGGESLEMWYDTELKHTFIVSKGKLALIEATASKTLSDPSQVGVDVVSKPMSHSSYSTPASMVGVRAQASGPSPQNLKVQAQVETPHSKVQGGPKRSAKYQGQETAE